MSPGQNGSLGIFDHIFEQRVAASLLTVYQWQRHMHRYKKKKKKEYVF